jgi:methionyl-tRNA synthetase
MEKIAKSIGLDVRTCSIDDVMKIDDEVVISKPEIPFEKVEDEEMEKLKKSLFDRFAEKPEISIEEFRKLDIRIGKILDAKKIEKSKKLLKLLVDIGDEKRQLVAGIAENHRPEDLIGKLVVVIANLKPAKIMGVESKGMILAADVGGKAVLLVPEKEVAAGTKVK